jgi:hypothetical protein
MLFRTGPRGMKMAADIPLSRDRDQQMIGLDLDPHDADS